jgi:hypothetical protein
VQAKIVSFIQACFPSVSLYPATINKIQTNASSTHCSIMKTDFVNYHLKHRMRDWRLGKFRQLKVDGECIDVCSSAHVPSTSRQRRYLTR